MDVRGSLELNKINVGGRYGGSIRYEQPIKLFNTYDGVKSVGNWFGGINQGIDSFLRNCSERY